MKNIDYLIIFDTLSRFRLWAEKLVPSKMRQSKIRNSTSQWYQGF